MGRYLPKIEDTSNLEVILSSRIAAQATAKGYWLLRDLMVAFGRRIFDPSYGSNFFILYAAGHNVTSKHRKMGSKAHKHIGDISVTILYLNT